MKTSQLPKILAAAACITAVLVSCASRRSEPIMHESFASVDNEVTKGEKLFMQHCDKCHLGGEAGLGPAINSNQAPQFIKRFQVRHGLGAMPSFTKEEISRDDLRAISKYMKAWKKHRR